MKGRNFRVGSVLLISILFIGLISSCSKRAGEGGLASISGKVYARDYDKDGDLEAEGYIGDVKVYIRVAGSDVQLDDIDTNYDGTYSFPFLRKGEYEVWVFSDCDDCLDGTEAIVQKVSIEDRKAEIVLPDFEIKI